MARFTCLLAAALCMWDLDVAPRSQPLTGGHVSAAATQAGLRDEGPRRKGSARIRGRVVAAASGQPVRKAQVIATSSDGRETRVTRSDVEGRYELKDLPAGRYRVDVTKGGFVRLSYGQMRPFEAGKPIELADAQIVDKVDFALPAGGVITGRVVDELGEPAADVRVTVMRYGYVQGRRQLVGFGPQPATNDIGEYRVFGLPPGQYVLAASPTASAMRGDFVSDDRAGYAPSFYPGTADVSQAQRVALETGQALTNIDIPLVPVRTARISGTAADSQGKPLSGALVMVFQRSIRTVLSTSGSQVRSDGTFTVSNLAPGDYVLRAMVPGSIADGAEMAAARVTVAGEDIADVHLVSVKPTLVSGRVIVDPSSGASGPTSALRLIAIPADPEDDVSAGLGSEGRIEDDYTFALKAPPGRALIRAEVPAGWALKAVRHNGSDVTDTGLEIRRGEAITGIEVELTARTTEVSGTVTTSRGDAATDYTVIVFSADRERWGYLSRFFRTARPERDGRYRVASLPPGDYHAVAVDYVEPGEASDPEFLERVKPGATSFRLMDGEAKTVHLKIHP